MILATLALAPADAGANPNHFPIDDFESSSLGALPAGWNTRSDATARFYAVAAEPSGNQYLRVRNKATHESLLRKAKVDLVKFPHLEWRWRANALPKGGNEQHKATCDSSAAINVVISSSKWKPRTIKYTWSTTLPVGTATTSPYCPWPGRCDVIVLQSGPDKKGQWVVERRNVLADYKRLYGKDSLNKLEIDGLIVMSDGDNTKSFSAADYDDIRFAK